MPHHRPQEMFLLSDVLCLVVLGVVIAGGWQGKEGRQKGPMVLLCAHHGWPFADPAVRIQPPGTTESSAGCAGGAGMELTEPCSQQVPLFTALAGLVASPHHGKNPTLCYIIRSDISGLVCASESSQE